MFISYVKIFVVNLLDFRIFLLQIFNVALFSYL